MASAHELRSASSSWTVRSKGGKARVFAAAQPLVRSELGPPGDWETDYFCHKLGLARQYFQTVTPEELSQHVLLLYAAKFQARISRSQLRMDIAREDEQMALYICPSLDTRDPVLMRHAPSTRVEARIEDRYLRGAWDKGQRHLPDPTVLRQAHKAAVQQRVDDGAPEGWVVQAFRSEGVASPDHPSRLRLFMLKRPEYPTDQEGFLSLAPTAFLSFINEPFYAEYERLVAAAVRGTGPAVSTVIPDEADYAAALGAGAAPNGHSIRVRVGWRRGTTHTFFLSISQMYRRLGFRCFVKAQFPFRNGVDVLTLWLSPVKDWGYAEVRARLGAMTQDISHTYVLPASLLAPLGSAVRDNMIVAGEMTAAHHSYAFCALLFAHHFLTLLPNEQDTAAPYKAALFPELDALVQGAPGATRIKMRLRQNMLTEQRLADAIRRYPALVKRIFEHFEELQSPHTPLADTTSEEWLKKEREIANDVLRQVPNEINQRVLLSCLTFNKCVLKTNFFSPTKNAISFRLSPSFLNPRDYPEIPHGIFFVVGASFRGFHIRFRDVSRGGIRLIRSGNEQAYGANVATVFDENYALALTQQRKNKDIPEGGSKGTILLGLEHQDKGYVAFDQYIDGILDLILPGVALKDYLKSEELIFFGPDEGTADMMDRACIHARNRGYKLWKSMTTGKSTVLGGIPHDTYAMTTRSVHQYVLGFYRRLGLDEEKVTKLQTGGPDGDLGSNEVLISKDRTTTVVDGSGVLHDPDGIARAELSRLAVARVMVREFDRKLLGPRGFFVDIRDVDVTLPDGSVVQSGLSMRNTMHLDPRATADVFVPCGGRPESVNGGNVEKLFDARGEPRFRVIVEGANLFFTQDARLRLEQAGVALVKDASANKGGVTSSSLEVLSALALDDADYQELMCAPTGTPPEKMSAFYRAYVAEVQQRVEENARLEFECIWAEAERTKRAKCVLSDEISAKIVAMTDAILGSSLWEDVRLRREILRLYTPSVLTERVGLDAIVRRVPEAYLRSIFAAFVAARYVYTKGPSANEFAFFDYITALRDGAAPPAARL